MRLHGAEFGATGLLTFESDFKRRRLAGRILTFGQRIKNGEGWWSFQPGSLFWSAPGRVHLDRGHDLDRLIGVGEELAEVRGAIDAVFKLARTAEADEALQLAEDGVLTGFSVEPQILQARRDPNDREVTLVERAQLRGVALTPIPADDAARLTAVFEAPGVRAAYAAQRAAWRGQKSEVLHKDEHGFAIGHRPARSFYDA
jgi:HK97 family phage prohead protease